MFPAGCGGQARGQGGVQSSVSDFPMPPSALPQHCLPARLHLTWDVKIGRRRMTRRHSMLVEQRKTLRASQNQLNTKKHQLGQALAAEEEACATVQVEIATLQEHAALLARQNAAAMILVRMFGGDGYGDKRMRMSSPELGTKGASGWETEDTVGTGQASFRDTTPDELATSVKDVETAFFLARGLRVIEDPAIVKRLWAARQMLSARGIKRVDVTQAEELEQDCFKLQLQVQQIGQLLNQQKTQTRLLEGARIDWTTKWGAPLLQHSITMNDVMKKVHGLDSRIAKLSKALRRESRQSRSQSHRSEENNAA